MFTVQPISTMRGREYSFVVNHTAYRSLLMTLMDIGQKNFFFDAGVNQIILGMGNVTGLLFKTADTVVLARNSDSKKYAGIEPNPGPPRPIEILTMKWIRKI